MRKNYLVLIDTYRVILQFLILIVAFLLPFYIDYQDIIIDYMNNLPLTTENLIIHIFYKIISKENQIIQNLIMGLLLDSLLLYLFIRPANKSIILNTGNCYHIHSLFYYYICAKILGYNRCSLILVPFYQQTKLIMNDVFNEYIFENIPFQETEDRVEITQTNFKTNSKEINIILEDTYPITETQLPIEKIQLPTIRITRCSPDIRNRVYCKNFISKVIDQFGRLPENSTINIFSTTNPKHFYEIVKNGLTLGDRSNISHIIVYQQEGSENRNFNEPHNIL